MWRREMEWILCVSDQIVELVPSWQTFPDGTKLEVTMILVSNESSFEIDVLKWMAFPDYVLGHDFQAAGGSVR